MTLSGSTADYTALLETVLTQTREQFTTWATENRETFAGLSTEGLQEKMVGLLLSNLESAGKSVQTVPVKQVLSMHQQEGSGRWIVKVPTRYMRRFLAVQARRPRPACRKS